MTTAFDYDVVIVGSGFGGSVAALRLTEKGYSVAVLEAGPRFEDADLPDTSFDVRNYLFAPSLGCYGIQRIDLLNDCLILSGAGVGGGSLVYANTLYQPPAAFYDDPQWRDITDWKTELAPYYDQATRMLGVITNPWHTPSDEVIRQVAEEMGKGDTFRYTPVGVLFPRDGESKGQPVDDPYFGGEGPRRHTCTGCGECMTGCRHNAKNTLVKNYLYLAEKHGAHVHPLTTVTRVVPRHGGGYDVHTTNTRAKTKRRAARQSRTYAAQQVIFAASALGTQRLLHTMKFTGELPRLSDTLGRLTRTNSESILGAGAPKDDPRDFTEGVAITSSFHPDEHTHIEPVRYGRGSNVMSLLTSVLTDDLGDTPRWRVWLRQSWHERSTVRRLYDFKHWSEHTVIALVMQSLDNSINIFPKRNRVTGKITLSSEQGHGAPNPTWIPLANEAVRRMARNVGGFPAGNIGEQFHRPLTAHFIGGCPIGKDAEHGVVDAYHRVFGYDGLHIVDGSAISANLGVNPSLTITAQAERAMAYWPNKGQADARPALGTAYQGIAPVEPAKPIVPASAPAALRLPIVGIT